MVGLIAGWLAAKITGTPQGLLRNLAVGLVGAILAASGSTGLASSLCRGFLAGSSPPPAEPLSFC
jgi:uncharacterized membrane protein YeaQ/YmgE (transglycosylase-associated protein family)